MHSSETVQPAVGPGLLLQLGRLIIRAHSNSPSPKLPKHKHKPSTSQQVTIQTQPKADEEDARLEANLSNHINTLWSEQIPVCVEVLLAPECSECYATMTRTEEPVYPLRGLLLERWTMRAVLDKSESPSIISSPWLLNAVRSQLHFSQLSAWRARLYPRTQERRRKLSRECNIKKLEGNCDEDTERKLNIVYSIMTPGDYKISEFAKPPTAHTFPLTDIGNNVYLKVVLESLPRIDDIPEIKCTCQKRRASKDFTNTEELVGRLNDLSIGSRKFDGAINSNIGTPSRRLSIISNPGSTEYLFTVGNDKHELVDDRMHTPCSESGKHKCNCDDESDNKDKNQAKKLDERRIKEIAKYKRRIRKEKIKKFNDSTSSEGEIKAKETTSIPILQASRFDRFRAIGCYRNQTYLTLPASRIETKSPFIDTDSITPPEFKKTNTVSTQTDLTCACGNTLEMKCEICSTGMVRSEANYNLASLQENGARRKLDDEDNDKSLKKHKCDNINSVSSFNDGIIKRPKLRRLFPIINKLDKIVIDRNHTEKDIKDLHLNTDDSVFSTANESINSHTNTDESNSLQQMYDDQFSTHKESKKLHSDTDKSKSLQQLYDDQFSTHKEMNKLHSETGGSKSLQQKTDDQVSKRQKTFSISDEDYILYEKCDYGTIDRHEIESPKEENPDFKFSVPDRSELNGQEKIESLKDEFIFPDPKRSDPQIPSPSEMDRFRWRFDSAASMVFHTKTGLPLTSSPAPLRRGKNCFDFDDSINGISGIKSALFHPISPVSPVPPASPASPAPAPRTPPKREGGKLKMGPSTGLLGSFEESALQGRLEAVATVHGFTAELGASGAFCPPHKRLPVTVFFYAPGGTAAPYMGHINLGPGGYRVARSGTVQVSLFNPHGTLVKMFVVLYDLSRMPPAARTFLRQRTLYMPAGAAPPRHAPRWLRYLIHLRFMTSKSGKLYLHTDIRLIVSRKADLDTAAAHSALLRPAAPLRPAPPPSATPPPPSASPPRDKTDTSDRSPIRVFGGSSEHDCESSPQIGYSNDRNSLRPEIGYSNGHGSEHSDIEYSNRHNSETSYMGYSNGHSSKRPEIGYSNGHNSEQSDMGSSNRHNSKNLGIGYSNAHVSEASPEIGYSNGYDSQASPEIGYSNGSVSQASPEIGYSNGHDFEASPEIGYDSPSVSYELRSFTFAPDNPKYSPR